MEPPASRSRVAAEAADLLSSFPAPGLRSSPNLEKLKIELHRKKTVANWEFLNAQWTDGMCANLQVVEIISNQRWLPISFTKLILSKSSLLRTLSVDECPCSQEDPLNELLTCRRASAQAQVLFKKGE